MPTKTPSSTGSEAPSSLAASGRTREWAAATPAPAYAKPERGGTCDRGLRLLSRMQHTEEFRSAQTSRPTVSDRFPGVATWRGNSPAVLPNVLDRPGGQKRGCVSSRRSSRERAERAACAGGPWGRSSRCVLLRGLARLRVVEVELVEVGGRSVAVEVDGALCVGDERVAVELRRGWGRASAAGTPTARCGAGSRRRGARLRACVRCGRCRAPWCG